MSTAPGDHARPSNGPEVVSLSLVGDALVAAIGCARLFDPGMVEQIDGQMRRAVVERRHLIIDLAMVRFLSSALLGRLVLLHQDLAAQQRRMVVFGANATVGEILRISGLDQRMDLCTDLVQALRLVESERP